MWFLLGALTSARAADGFGAILPTAGELDAGDGAVGLWVGAGYQAFVGSGWATGARASVGLHDRVAVLALGGGLQPLTPERGSALGFHLVSVRVDLIDRPELHVSPLLTHLGVWEEPATGSVGLGFAVEGGNDRVRADLTIPSLFGVAADLRDREYGLYPRGLAVGAEGGITAILSEHHSFRAGLPAFTWRIRGEHVYAEVSGSFALLVGAIGLEVGGRF